jgi:uncharacterized protein YjbJ (UPF0337 family)
MNSDKIKGQWKQIMGDIKKRWGKLTDDDLIKAAGNTDILAGIVQERYGQRKQDANDEVKAFFKNLK